ncbi:hypothetical protein SAMN04488510_11710 [Fervidobacterium changbaicum]|uniref:Uncharacterized protein n=2 Tax=Fervidobacterium TaxID=2422 RepID=A0AAI8CLD6_FERIS|nr:MULTISPECIES: hypothetical protein [Fervidobacterium]AMW32643.1 hypothetical protein NA23_04665 [Fervidobacterium islandicum]QAV32506.1 hypothetical protein CBS1_01270 [Fervidobacterium changbaicum]SDH50467.1 hypothetical protein SAMN04488510_11710 [Fervidobacterium changbaicum]
MEPLLWIISISCVLVDNVFKEYFTLVPLYFLLESVVEIDEKNLKSKVMRLFLFSLFYQSFAYQRLTILWVILTLVIVVIELYKDVFYYPWSASLLQAILFLIPYYYAQPFALIYGFVLDCALFAYIYKKLEFGGA